MEKLSSVAVKCVFVTTTSQFPQWLDLIANEYAKKISFWLPIELRNLYTKNVSRDSKEHKIKTESESLLNFIKNEDFVLLCDEKGKSLNSIDFAKKFENILGSSKKRLIIIVGGAFGVSEAIKERADFTISFGPLVMNHHLAMAVILEQTYRALTILKGVKYHNE